MRRAAIAFALVACTSRDPSGVENKIVVGVQSSELGSLTSACHIVVKRDGVVQKEIHRPFAPGGSTALAEAIDIDGPPGALVEATAELLAPNPADPPVVSRTATSRIASGKRLLRLRLDPRCLGVACAASLTCSGGACVPIDVPEAELEDFSDDWPTAAPDACRPSRPGPPELMLGEGQSDYRPLTDGQTLQLEAGPQGGHHIWMAVRMRNLRQSGSTTTITSTSVDGPLVLAPLGVVFTYDRDEGGYCKVAGLRYQVDVSGLAPDGSSVPAPNVRDFLGRTLIVTAEVVDPTGARASDSKRVHLANEILR